MTSWLILIALACLLFALSGAVRDWWRQARIETLHLRGQHPIDADGTWRRGT